MVKRSLMGGRQSATRACRDRDALAHVMPRLILSLSSLALAKTSQLRSRDAPYALKRATRLLAFRSTLLAREACVVATKEP